MFFTALFCFMLISICIFLEANDRATFATFTCHLIIVLMRLVVLADKLYFICIHVYHCFHFEYVDVGI